MKNERTGSIPVWEGVEYPRISEGRYSAVACRIQGPEWVRRFGRWSLIVEFELLSDPIKVCVFFNMGTNREQPKAGRHSRYFKAWTLANGGLPTKGQPMNPEVFLDGQMYEIEVSNSWKDSEERQKADAEVYSRVTAIVSANHPSRQATYQEAINQESRITQSTNQAINQSSRPGGANQPLKVIKFA